MKKFVGTDEQLINSLEHIAKMPSATQTEKAICAEAAARLRAAMEKQHD